ncbi:hypothetical protein HZF08_15465 [Paenibacillus sp. CGMCC 1.16610]|uniref:Uncharacterized protein n=2 Tax=Paenibacillus TaxID=44249 RepID=A0ABW9UN94_9BACL|nr:hypothetical protein [Paenibacillus anseongense]MBA2939715.1 hypothetical protein [Paenibacillus sp. CGMCC 1.16610]MVQ39375.1 hypothetical protein [Paenibacillus anseongense]
MNLAIQKEKEDPQLVEGIKDLLKESYPISEDDMILIMNKASDNSEKYLVEYFAFVEPIQAICDGIRIILENHLKQVELEEEMDLKMVNEAAVWHAFECIRRYFKSQANLF